MDGDSHYTWAIGSKEYLIESLRVVKQRIAPINLTLKSKVTSALPSGYKPELDASNYLDDDNTISAYYDGLSNWDASIFVLKYQ